MDGGNPASTITGFLHTSQVVVWDFFRQQYGNGSPSIAGPWNCP